ncbi:MAG: tyrosine-type recombinase/integrase [Synergistaceae bacterium]|nr:tyrosine-type recombinase/integrase [Synergistaceae bacterium]
MHNNYTYTSSLSNHISNFIAEKQSLGYKYQNEAYWMKNFDDYWRNFGYNEVGLTPENISEWLIQRENESSKTLSTRLCVIREFSKYLNGLGIQSYIPNYSVKLKQPFKHKFTQSEISDLFAQIDNFYVDSVSTYTKRMADEYPIIFRLIYLHGLRISEACYLRAHNVDLKTGIITIQDGKGHIDRLVYMAEDMHKLCCSYFAYVSKLIGDRPFYFFPGKNIKKSISRNSVNRTFNICWRRTSYADKCDIKPTVHDLRHAFIMNRINIWLKRGLNFAQMLPYLSKFLGHKSFVGTYYYCHYAEEAARIIQERDSVIHRVIPKVKRR